MSGYNADTLMPLFFALPEDQRHVFVEQASKHLQKRDKPKRKTKSLRDRIADQLGEEWREGNDEMMITNIINA